MMKKTSSRSKVFLVLIWVLFAVFLGVFLYSGYRIWSYYSEKNKASGYYENILSNFTLPPETSGSDSTPSGEAEPTEKAEPTPKARVDAAAIAEASPDFTGWLYSPDTPIDYPVVQGSDNDYYLHRLIDGSYNYNGCLFTDYRCDKGFADHNTIIYGHNMFSGIMFGTLQKYKDAEYYKEHPVMYFETEYGTYLFEVFAAYTTTHDSQAYTISFFSDEDYLKYLDYAISQSSFDAGLDLTAKDHIVTLSTCAYEFDNARYVVLCRVSKIADIENVQQTN